MSPFATAPIVANGPTRFIEAPVIASDGLATEVVRALDAAGVNVSEISVRSASLDDVFLTLTGHVAEDEGRQGRQGRRRRRGEEKTAQARQTQQEAVR